MVLKINPALFPLWRDSNRLQIGQGERAIQLSDVTPAQERLINMLYRGVADEALGAFSKSAGQSAQESEALLARLSPALLRGSAGLRSELGADFIEQAFAEIIRSSFAQGIDGLTVLNHRATRAVQLIDGDSTSLLLALALASAGLGAIHCTDASEITAQDVGPLGYASSELGHQRHAALARKLEVGSHPCRVVPPNRRYTLQASVLVGSHLTDARRYESLIRGSTAHLAIEYSVHQTLVSPLVIPGKTPCLSCRYRAEIENDSDWAAITTQLQMRTDRLDDSASKLFACGAALSLLLNFIDDPRTHRFEGLKLDHETGEISSVTWQKDSNCSCE